MEYKVAWSIDIMADSSREAAEKALEIQRDKESMATVFDVSEEVQSGSPERIDVSEQ